MPWWKKLFNEDYLAIEPHLDEEAPLEVEAILQMTELKPKSKILDLCCGHGRHAIPLAKKDFQITGFDFSEHLLQRAAQAAEESGVTLRLIHGDTRQLPFEDEFDAVISMFTAFGYFEQEEDNQKVLSEVFKALKPGGVFLMDVLNREHLLKNWQPKRWSKQTDFILLEEMLFDFFRGVLEVNRTLIHDDHESKKSNFSLRLYTLVELLEMLRKANLYLEAVFGDFKLGQYSADSPRMIIMANKPRERAKTKAKRES